MTLGLPGALPVLNQHAVELAMRIGLALNCTVQQMLDALEKVAGPKVRARVSFQRDERIAGIVANWPGGATAARAARLGLQPAASFEAIVRQYIDDCRRTNPAALRGLDA